MDATTEQLKTLVAVVDAGSFDRAASRLGVTPSAVSLRMRGLEEAVGRSLVTRTRPIQPTDVGRTVLRYARQLDSLLAETAAELDGLLQRPEQELTIAVSSDALATWVLDAVGTLDDVSVHLIVDDDDDAVQDGRAVASIGTAPIDARGCTSALLGTLRSLPVATPGFLRTWFPDGITEAALATAPHVERVTTVGRTSDHRRDGAAPRSIRVRHVADALGVVQRGLAWGSIPEPMLDGTGLSLLDLPAVETPCYWTHWSTVSRVVARLDTAVRSGAAGALRPAAPVGAVGAAGSGETAGETGGSTWSR